MRTASLTSSILAIAMVAISLFPLESGAQMPVRGVIRFGGEHGGDKVGEFEYSDGSTPDVIAGGGLVLTGGVTGDLLTRGRHGLEAQVNVGVKYRTIPPADNQDANWLRFPVEGLLYYRAPAGFRLGAGMTVHFANTLSASGAVLNDRVEFENTPGFLLQAEYVRKNVSFDVRYTALEYEISGGDFEPVDASSIGVGVSFFIGRSSRKP